MTARFCIIQNCLLYTSGPFVFESRSPQENIVLKKNESYWGEKAHLDEVEFKIVADADMVVTNLKGGSIDMYMRCLLYTSRCV